MKKDKVAQTVRVFDELRKIEKSLNNLGVAECNHGLTPRQLKREQSLRVKAQGIAHRIGMKCYFQTDPRGCSLYVYFTADMPKGSAEWKICEVYNTHGIACCK